MFKVLKKMKWHDWCFALICVAFIVVQVWLDMTMPQYMNEITVLIETPGSEMSQVWKAGAMMLLCSLGSVAASVITAIFAARIGSNLSFTLRECLFKKVQTFSMEEIGKFSTASLITRSTNDIQQVLMFIVMGLQMLIKAPITAVWAICKIADQQWQWSLSTAVGVVVVLSIVGICITLVLPKVKRMQKLTDDINRVTRENLNGLRVVRAYNAESYQEDKFEKANEELTKTQLFQQRTMAFMMPSMQLVQSGLMLAVYWIGAVLMSSAADRIGLFGNMMVFSQYTNTLYNSFSNDIAALTQYKNAVISGLSPTQSFDTYMREASSTAQIFAKSVNAATISEDNYRTHLKQTDIANQAQNKSLNNCKVLIDEYQTGLKNCGLTQEQYISALQKSNPQLAQYLSGLKGGEATIGGYVGALVKAKAATIALQLASAALNIGISLAVTGLVKLISYWVNYEKNLRDKLEEVKSECSELESELSSLNDEFETTQNKIYALEAKGKV